MANFYTASKVSNVNGRGFSVSFRHPMRNDKNGKRGLKVKKGLGTDDASKAEKLVEELNGLLRDESLWPPSARPLAEHHGYSKQVVEIFYDKSEPENLDYRKLRNDQIHMPGRESGYSRALLVGVPGVGKSTLVRQLIGSDPDEDRFPSASLNRTTTYETEVISADKDYDAVVTFMSEDEARSRVGACLLDAVLKAVLTPDDAAVARILLEQSDPLFRLKYVLGDWPRESDEENDAYEEDDQDTKGADGSQGLSDVQITEQGATIRRFINQVRKIATDSQLRVEQDHGSLDSLSPQDRNAALDLIQESAEASEEFIDLVSEIVDELQRKFDCVQPDRYQRTTTGWPIFWRMTMTKDRKGDFLATLRFFFGISARQWGMLVTPLVNGIRVEGPFFAKWSSQKPSLVLIDSIGLRHEAGATADLPDQIASYFSHVDVILLVEAAHGGMTNYSAAKALEAVGSAGYTKKLAVVFTNMDRIRKAENLPTPSAKKAHLFGGIIDVLENQVARTLSRDVARHMASHLEENTFYLGALDKADPKPAISELLRLVTRLQAEMRHAAVTGVFPEYSIDNLVLGVKDATEAVRGLWHTILDTKPWQTIKAFNRRYAEGREHYFLDPAANLRAELGNTISRFLDNPIGWEGPATPEAKREIIDSIKNRVAEVLPDLVRERLRTKPIQQWKEAYWLRGPRSTFDRKLKIESIFERWVPIPRMTEDSVTQEIMREFLGEVKGAVNDAIERAKNEWRAGAVRSSETHKQD